MGVQGCVAEADSLHEEEADESGFEKAEYIASITGHAVFCLFVVKGGRSEKVRQ